MSKVICPNCKVEMKKNTEPDITIDKCPRCAGIFLDKNELNVLATGMAGNIEFCSIDEDYHKDNYPARACPKCSGQTMDKINLLHFTDIIFDYCSGCGGFFLDKGEMKDVNEKLQEIHGSKFSQEYRDYKDEHLVRIDILKGVVAAPIEPGLPVAVPAVANSLKITVYFLKPLGIELKVFDEGWLSRLAKIFKIHKGQDIALDNHDFDAKFIIQADNEEKAKKIFTGAAQQAILDFVAKKPQLFSTPGRIKVFDSRIVYLEGPYSDDINVDHNKAFTVVIKDLLNIAKMIEAPAK